MNEIRDTLRERFAPYMTPDLRDYLDASGWNKQPPPPRLPQQPASHRR